MIGPLITRSQALLIALGVGLAICAIGALVLLRTNHGPRGPRLLLPSQALRLPPGRPGEVVKGTLRIRNEGDEPLAFRLEPSCGCSELTPRQGKIDRGREATIALGVHCKYEGVEKGIQITIISNDPLQPTAHYQVFASCPAPLAVSPESIHFGALKRGDSANAVLEVRPSRGAALASLTSVTASSNSPYVVVQRTSASPDALTFAVRLTGEIPSDYFVGAILLRFPEGNRGVDVPVTARLQRSVVAAPSSLFLRRGASGTAGEATVIVSRSDGQPLGPLVEVLGPRSLRVEETDPRSGPRRRFTVREALPLTSPATLGLKFQGVPESVELRVYPAARPTEPPRSPPDARTAGRRQILSRIPYTKQLSGPQPAKWLFVGSNFSANLC